MKNTISKTPRTGEISVREKIFRLGEMDLTPIRRKLQEPFPEGRGWSTEQAIEAEKWYRRYLHIIIQYPDATSHVPNEAIDAFWHQHILDTEKYANDCEHVLGYFLHHYPYFGLNGDEEERDRAFVETNRLFKETFGEDCTHMFIGTKMASGCKDSGSGTGCKQGCRKGSHHRYAIQEDLIVA